MHPPLVIVTREDDAGHTTSVQGWKIMRSRKSRDIVPDLPIVFGLPELEAAASIGVSATKFRELVCNGLMPSPRIVGGKLVYDVDELRSAFKNMPHRDGEGAEIDTWADLTSKSAA